MKSGQPKKGSISENNFGYRSKLEVYANISSDITKLGEIGHLRKDILGDQNVYLLKKSLI